MKKIINEIINKLALTSHTEVREFKNNDLKYLLYCEILNFFSPRTLLWYKSRCC